MWQKSTFGERSMIIVDETFTVFHIVVGAMNNKGAWSFVVDVVY